MQMKTNKNGVKLLAAVMVLALAFAGVAVAVSSFDDTDAAVKTAPESATPVSTADALKSTMEGNTGDIIISITDNFNITAVIMPSSITQNITIYGNGKTITATGTSWSGAATKNMITLDQITDKKTVTIYDLVFDSDEKAYGINISNSAGKVVMDNVESKDSAGAGVTVNSTEVTMTNCKTSGDWGGINVDVGSSQTKGGKLTIDSIVGIGSIYSESYKVSTDTQTSEETAYSTITITKADQKATMALSATKCAGSWMGFYEDGATAFSKYEDMKDRVDNLKIDDKKTVNINVIDDTSLSTTSTILKGTTVSVADGKALTLANNTTFTLNKDSFFQGVISDSNGTIFSKSSKFTVNENLTFVGGTGASANTKDAIKGLADAGVTDINVTDMTLSSKLELNGVDLKIADGNAITVTNDSTNALEITNGSVEGTITYGGKSVTLKIAGSFTIYGGSVVIYDGSVSGEIEVEDGATVVLKQATINGNLTIKGDGTPSGCKVIFDDVTVEAGVKMTLTPGITYQVYADGATDAAAAAAAAATKPYMYVYGSLITPSNNDAVTITVKDYGSFKTYGTANIQQTITIASEGTHSSIDLADSMSTITINNDVSSSNTYSQTQTVVIAETLCLKTGTVTTIYGKLVINEGVTLIIEDGAELVVGNATAQVIINGTMEVEEGGKFTVSAAEKVEISGKVVSDGTVTINSTVKVKTGGKVLIDNGDNSTITIESGMTIEKGGELEIRGGFDISTISNKGTITLNGATLKDSSTIKMAADGAVVNIISFIADADGKNLTITDAALVYEKVDNVNVSVAKNNKIVFNGKANVGVKGVTITEAVAIQTINNQKYYSNDFILAGTITIADETVSGYTSKYNIDISVEGDAVDKKSNSVKVVDSLVIGKNVVVDVASNILEVSGTITATAEGSQLKATAGTIDVTGSVETIAKITANINAFGYETMVEGTTHYNYTTLKSAISNGATTISAMGTVFILEDVEIPAGVTIKSESGAKIFVGDSETRNITVVVKDGAQLRGNNIEVKATLEFENKKDNRSNTIISDVSVIGEVASKYTNVFTALDKAVSGDVVTIAVDVVLDRNVTIKEGVTLNIPSGKTISVSEGVTVYVNGTLKSSGTVKATDGAAFSDKADKITHTAKIDVKGTFMSISTLEYSTYRVAGAYFNMVDSTGNFNYVMPVESAAPLASKITNGEITINGENVVGDITFEGTKTQAVTVTLAAGSSPYAGASLKADSVTLSYASMTITYDATYPAVFNGTVKTSVGEIEIVNITQLTVTTKVVNDEVQMSISGTPVQAINTVDEKSVTIVSGSVFVLNVSQTSADPDLILGDLNFTIAENAKLTVSGTNAGLTSNLNSNSAVLVVDGELVAYNGGKVTADTLVVNGTFTVAPADSDLSIYAGEADIKKYLIVGLSYDVEGNKITLGSSATVNAEAIGSVKTIFVANGSTVTEKLIEDVKSTQFFVEDALWMTAYQISTNGADAILIDNITCDSIVEAQFENWYYVDSDGKKVAVGSSSPNDKKIGDVDKVIANITYEVYTVNVQVAEGIDDVYLDGILMSYVSNGIFTAMVKAGQHTIEYTLANGYGGEAVMLVNNEKVSGYKFTASGDFDRVSSTGQSTIVEYKIILQGIEKTGYVPDSPDTPAPVEPTEKDDSMGLTEYLLIVLVVLAAILVVVVAIRMMRS